MRKMQHIIAWSSWEDMSDVSCGGTSWMGQSQKCRTAGIIKTERRIQNFKLKNFIKWVNQLLRCRHYRFRNHRVSSKFPRHWKSRLIVWFATFQRTLLPNNNLRLNRIIRNERAYKACKIADCLCTCCWSPSRTSWRQSTVGAVWGVTDGTGCTRPPIYMLLTSRDRVECVCLWELPFQSSSKNGSQSWIGNCAPTSSKPVLPFYNRSKTQPVTPSIHINKNDSIYIWEVFFGFKVTLLTKTRQKKTGKQTDTPSTMEKSSVRYANYVYRRWCATTRFARLPF